MAKQRGKKRERRYGKLLATKRKVGPRDCGICSLCVDIDREVPRTIRHGVVEVDLEPDTMRVGLGLLKEEGGCLWKRGVWGREHESRPDRTGVVPWLMPMPSKRGNVLLFLDPRYSHSHLRNHTKRLIQSRLDKGHHVYIYDGEKTLYMRP